MSENMHYHIWNENRILIYTSHVIKVSLIIISFVTNLKIDITKNKGKATIK